MINNLSQLKKTISNGAMFNIIKHYIKPEYTGQIRKPNKIQTNGFYSIVPEEPENPVTKANGGKGSWIEYGKASDWTFENGICTQYHHGRAIWEIQVIEQ